MVSSGFSTHHSTNKQKKVAVITVSLVFLFDCCLILFFVTFCAPKSQDWPALQTRNFKRAPAVRCKMQPIVTFYNTATWWWEVAFSYLCVQPPQPWVRLFSAPWDSVCPERSQRSQVQCDLKRQIQYADLSQQYLLKCTHLCLCCWDFNLIWFNYGQVLHFWLPFMVTRASLGT